MCLIRYAEIWIKVLRIVSLPYFVYLRYWSICLYIAIVCLLGCEINFENNLIFLIKLLLPMPKKSRQKLKCLENKKRF